MPKADNKNRGNQDRDPGYTARMPFSPENVEVTQKIDIKYSDIALDKNAKQELAEKIKEKQAVSSSSLLGKSIFNRKRLIDDYVKSASIVDAISSVPPLRDKLELQDIDSNYELKSELASGAQGVIRNAFDKSLQRDVVVKSLKTGEDDGEHAARDENLFVSEARIMAQLDHPSIIPLYGLHSGPENGLHLAMKHIHGKTLQAYLDDVVTLYEREGVGNFDEERSIANRIEYLIKVCEAIDYAHCKGVIHRDLKPENIMIGNYGEVYVMDWGLACLTRCGEKKADDGDDAPYCKCELVGTPCYIAPEIIRGGLCSPQSDIFSLGLILFEIVTLNKAVTGETVKEALTNIINSNYQPFRHRFLKTPLSPDLKAIIAKATREPASRRYKTANDMAGDLKLYLMREETSARPDNALRKCVRAMVNHKMITSVVVLSILLCLAGISIFSLYSQNILIKEQKAKESMLAGLQYEVSVKANDMEGIFSFFKSQLANLSYQAGNVLSYKPVFTPRIYAIENYIGISGFPPDYIHSPAYKQKISLDFGVFRTGPGIKLTDETCKRIATLQPMLKHIMFKSDRLFHGKSTREIKDIIIRDGATLSWVYVGLKNGSILCYPGGDIYDKDYDPRKRPWYRKALTQKNSLLWSEPYKDAFSSEIVMSCSQCVYNKRGEFQGVAAMDVSLDYIRKRVFENKTEHFKEYLVNKEGKIILASGFEGKRAGTDKKSQTLILEDFPFKNKFIHAMKQNLALFEAEEYGRKYIFSLNEIPSMGYYYIFQVSEEKLRRHWEKHASK
ncbi:MAG: serine/threonine protein kinase [Victivallales bacterium]